MKEKLTIRDFGPIKDMSFEFKKINILIGDQGTGKSTVAKLLSAIKNSISLELFDLPKNKTEQFYGHLDLVGIKNYIKKESILIYTYDNFLFELKDGKVSINKEMTLEESMYFSYNYVPAERIMVSALADSLYALLEVKAELPKLFLRFGNKYQSSRKKETQFDYKDILGISFTHRDNKDYILLADGNEITLTDASSGIQGCVPLLTVVDSIMSESISSGKIKTLIDKNWRLLVIEEVELNCFPETQNKLIKYIIDKNTIRSIQTIDLDGNYLEKNDLIKNQLVITTHSPYILTSLNNLMYAFSVGKNHYEEVDKIVESKYWINPNDVSAYMLLPNGICENILDYEQNMIKAEKIDEVSSFLNQQFDALLNIELVKK